MVFLSQSCKTFAGTLQHQNAHHNPRLSFMKLEYDPIQHMKFFATVKAISRSRVCRHCQATLQAWSKCTEHTVLHGSACIASDTRLCIRQDTPALLPNVQYWKGRLYLLTDVKGPIIAFQQMSRGPSLPFSRCQEAHHCLSADDRRPITAF